MKKIDSPKLNWIFIPSLTEVLALLLGCILVIWYAWIMDDAYVYFRYVDNWIIHNHGLVWNHGEYVEGFSSPFWVLYLSALRLLHLDYWNIVRLTAIICFLAFWYLACLVNRGLIPQNIYSRSLNVPLVYLCFTYAISSYFSSGLEAPLVIVAAAVYAAAIIWPHSRALQVLIGLSPLVRHELVLPFVIFLAWSWFYKRVKPTIATLVFIASVGGYEVFRIWYYADIFPNTFYLKDEISIAQGIYYLYDSFIPYYTISYLISLGLIYAFLAKHEQTNLYRKERLAMMAISIPVLLYVVKIGGDPRHFRYLIFPYVLIVLASGGLVESLHSKLTSLNVRWMYAAVAILAISIGMSYPRQLQQHPIFRSAFGYKHNTFLKINDSAAHRLSSTGITPPLYSFNTILSYQAAKNRFENDSRLDATDIYNLNANDNWIKPLRCKNRNKPISTADWCQTAYLNASSSVVHSLGLTEPFLAHVNMHSDRPGHKLGLIPLAQDILNIRCEHGFSKGVFDTAMNSGELPIWLMKNIDTLNKIEKKVYNNHDFIENINLALKRIPYMEPL